MRRTAPRPLATAVEALTSRLAPAGTLSRVQRAWPEAVGPAVSEQATPVAEGGGTLTVSCSSAVWAQELDLLGPELVEALNEALGEPLVRHLRCRATAPGQGSRKVS